MSDVTRRDAIKLAAVGTVGLTASTASAAAQKRETYEKATVEWADTSIDDRVALRVGPQAIHFVAGIDQKTLIIAVTAGLNGWKVDFTTAGVRDDQWQRVKITKVHKS